jgi:cystathionine beta-lyase
MSHDLDKVIDRCGTDSVKWCEYPEEALPLWVADMDFCAPEPVVRALLERVEHGVFGYGAEPPEMREVIVTNLQSLYGWTVSEDALIFLPGVINGFNLACQALAVPGDGILLQSPAYPPILRAPANAECSCDEMELTCQPDGHYGIDWDLFEETVTPRTRVFILCNPHNPVGRVFRQDELQRMAEICLRHDIVVCSDEIHADFVYRGNRHIPIASIDPEIAERTVTLMAPSKTYNIAGLHFAVAIVPDPELREKLQAGRKGLVRSPGVLDYVAALAAYREGQTWLHEVLHYLEANRDFTFEYVCEHLPGIHMARPEGTYLAWLDCREVGLPGKPHEFFLDRAKVALNDGGMYGQAGEGFVRLNFGCPRATLSAALQRMEAAMQGLDGR